MRDIRAARFMPTSFATDITRTRFVFVQVDPVIGRAFPMELVRHFDKHHAGLFSYGSIARPAVRSPAWWADNFRSTIGSMRHGVSDGTWLFEYGMVAGYHAGVSPIIDEKRFVAYFAEIVQRKLGTEYRSDADSARSYDDADRDARERRATPVPVVPDEPSPFAILGVTEGASDEQVRDAWREQMKLNHPDRVAHLSPALQKFALAQTMEVQKAFDTITRMRGGRR